MAGWTAQIRDMQSGDLKAEARLLKRSAWGQGDLTERSAYVVLHDKYTKEQWHDILGRWYDRAIVFMWDGQPVAEGMITDAPDYNARTHTVEVRHIPVPALLERRWMHGVGTSDGGGGYVRNGEFAVSGVSIAGAVVRVLEVAYTAPISAAWPIPVQLPGVEGGTFAKSWPFHQFQNAAAIIKELTSRDDGPQMDLRPVIVNDKLTRVQRVGTLTGPRFNIHIDADDSAAARVGYGEHGKDTATGIHLPGNGRDEDMRVGAAFLPESAGLARDAIYWAKTEPDVGRLVRIAEGRLRPRSRTTIRRPLTAKTRKLDPSALRVGSTIGLYSDDRFWVPDFQLVRVVGFSGQCDETYRIETVEA